MCKTILNSSTGDHYLESIECITEETIKSEFIEFFVKSIHNHGNNQNTMPAKSNFRWFFCDFCEIFAEHKKYKNY